MPTRRTRPTPSTALLLAALAALPAPLAGASDWLSVGGGLWDDPANWSAGVPDSTEDSAVFNAGFPAGSASINLDGGTFSLNHIAANNFGTLSLTNGSLVFSATGLGIDPSVTTGPDDGFLSLNTDLLLNDTLRLDAAAGTTIRVLGDLTGSAGLTAAGDGLVILNNDASAWTGGLTVEAGTVRVEHANALGTAGLATVTGGLLQLNANTAESFIAFGGAIAINHSTTQQGDITLFGGSELHSSGGTLGGALGLAAGNTSVVRVNAARTLTLGGGTSGPGAMRIDADGTVRFTGLPLAHTGGLTLDSGTVLLQTDATFGGDLVINNGMFDVAATGSLAGIGGSTFVEQGGTLIVREEAGSVPADHSVMTQSVRLNGGNLQFAGDLDLTGFLHAGSTGGTFLLNTPFNYTAGGTNTLDLNTLPGGANLTLGAASNSSYAAGLQLTPHASDNTLHFGNGSATLRVRGVIADVGATPTHVDVTGPAVTQFDGANTYTGETVIRGGTLFASNPDALGAGSVTRVLGGQLRVNTSVNESIVLEGGDLRLLSNTTYAMPIDITDGTVLADNRATLTGPITLHAGGAAQLDGAFEISTSVTGDTDLNWRLGDSLSIVSGSLDFAGGLVVDADDDAHRLDFNSASTYTGVTELSTGEFNISHAQALGSDAAGTVLHSGELTLFAATNEDFTLNDGRFVVETGGALGSLTTHGGDFLNYTLFNTPTTLASGEVRWIAVNNRVDSVISGPGDIDFAHNATIFSGSDFTGTATVSGSNTVTTQHAMALGSTDGITVVEGTLNIDVASMETIRADGGFVRFRATDAPNLNTVILADGGSVSTTVGFGGAITVEDRGVLREGRYTGAISGQGELLLLSGGAPGTTIASANPFRGIVESLSDSVFERADVFNHAAQIAHTRDELALPAGSDRSILVNDANLRFDNDVTLGGLWLVHGGFVGQGAVTADQLVLHDLNDDNQPGGTLTVNDFLVLSEQPRIESRIQGSGDLIIDGIITNNFANIIGLTGDIVLVRGAYYGYLPSSFASGGSTLRFTHGSTSILNARTNNDSSNRIARTIDATDTYYAEIVGRTTGTIHLSDGFDLVSRNLQVDGPINAHDLTLTGGVLTGANLDGLTGNLTITRDLERGYEPHNLPIYTLRVGLDGSLQNLDSITLAPEAELILDNRYNTVTEQAFTLNDRLGDGIEILSHGGRLSLYGQDSTPVVETVGTLTLLGGRTEVYAGNSNNDTTLAITQLQRPGHATVTFQTYNSSSQGDYMLLNPGVAAGEMIAPWAMTFDGFATVDAQNFITAIAATTTDINAATIADHVLVETMQTMTADRTAQSLGIGDTSTQTALDLGGNTLTLERGGIFLHNSTALQNGTITSGSDELVIASGLGFSPLALDAEVVDNGAPLALVLDGVQGQFSGGLNHTGGTWIHDSDIVITDIAAATAGGNDLHLSNTDYEFDLGAAAPPIAYGTLTVADGARFEGPNHSGYTEVGFDEIRLRGGSVSALLVGDGLIAVDGRGRSSVVGDLSAFTGDLQVEDGYLTLYDPLHDDVSVLITGGTFDSEDRQSATGSAIVLAGGTLSGGGHGYQRDFHVTAESYLVGVEIDSAVTGSGQLTVRHELTSSSGRETVVLESADLSGFSGDWHIESGYVSLRAEQSGIGTGDITINPGATLQLWGITTVDPAHNHITLDGGGTLYATDQATHAGDLDASGIVWLGTRHQGNVFLNLTGQVRLHDGLSILGRSDNDNLTGMGTVRLSGELLVGSDVRWNPGFNNIDITGTVRPDTADASITFDGLASIPASTATFATAAGRTLTLLDDIGPGSLTLRDGGAVIGDGTLRADVVAETNALIAPGDSAGVLTLDGEFTMLAGSTLRSELIDSATSAGTGFDQLAVTGTFTAGGTLALETDPGFAPSVGDTFDLVVADSIAGTFDAVTGSAIDGLLGLTVRYGPTTIQAEAGLLGDLTGDGFVGVEDLDLLLARWGDTADAGDWRAGDADGSGTIGHGDLQVVLNHWSNGAPPDTNIPEPGSLALLALGSLLLTRRRR